MDRVDLQVFHTKEGLESRRIGVKGEARPYAFYRETAQNRAEVFVGRWYLAEVEKYEIVFLSLLALGAPSGRAAVPDSALCIHRYPGKQCSFLHHRERAKPRRRDSGNSTGKAITVNGDKALLEYDGTAWTANGWPVCGTSGVCSKKAPGRMHCNAEPGKDESGVAAASGRGIYESVRTDHHEPLGQGRDWYTVSTFSNSLLEKFRCIIWRATFQKMR